MRTRTRAVCAGPSTGAIYSAAATGGRTCAVVCLSFARLATGAKWSNRTRTAPWAARSGHTTVIDAAGAMYVIGGGGGGGTGGTDYFQDVWASTDGGA